MKHTHKLPADLIARYRTWQTEHYATDKDRFARLAAEGQAPATMVISCCDSRVHATAIFGADIGEFFIHRNIANLVPPYRPATDNHGTSAALEYAVLVLQVKRLIVLGHSQCGGVQAYLDMCRGQAPHLTDETNFISHWIDILRPAFERLHDTENAPPSATALEQAGVVISLENLMTFPFIQQAVEAKHLHLHGLWHNIGKGALYYYDAAKKQFLAV